MNELLYQLFRDCTVRLTTSSDRGTGFFVAPGVILTCAHVIKGVTATAIEVRWLGEIYTTVSVDSLENPDLALLSVPIDNHPCVYLDKESQPGHKLYSYGYPDLDRNGSSITVECEGPSDEGQLLTIKDENVRPGFSGAPLLNQRTMKVCGIVKSERQVRVTPSLLRGLGGQAIPITVVFAQWSELEGRNCKFHQQDTQWTELLKKHLTQTAKITQPADISYAFDKLGVRQQYLETILTQEKFCRWADERYIDETARPLLMSVAPYDLRQSEREAGIKRDLIEVVEEHLARSEQILILGEPGSGKTTALERLMYIYALRGLKDTSAPVPVLIPLNRYDGSLINIFRAAFNEVGRFDLCEEQIATLLKSMEVLILFDGLNELGGQRQKGVLDIWNFMGAHPCYCYALTCRTQNYHNDLEFQEAWEVQPMDEREVERYLKLHLGDEGKELYSQIRRDERLLGLARNPLVLRMIQETGEVPKNRGELYQNFVRKMLWREGQKGDHSHHISGEVKMRALAQMGYKMQQNRMFYCQERQIKDSFNRYLHDWCEPYNWRELLEEIKLNGLLRATGSGWTFIHQSFQEFFAAYALEEDGLSDDVLDCVIGNPEWNEVLFLLSGITQQGSMLVRRLLSSDLFMAAKSISQEASPEQEVLQLVIKELGDASRSENWTIRRTCADLMGEIRSTLAHSYLINLLEDDNSEVRWGAVHALRLIGVRGSAIQGLLPLLNDPFWVVQGETAMTLGELGAIEAIPQLGQLLDSNLTYCRISATYALVKLSFSLSKPNAEKLLNSPSQRVQTLANFATQVVAHPNKTVFIRKSLKNGSSLVREAALMLLVRLKDFSASPEIVLLLTDSLSSVRATAVAALGKLQAYEFTSEIVRLMLSDPEAMVKTSAVGALESMHAQEAFPHFFEAAKDESPEVRLVVARSFGRLRLAKARPVLKELAQTDPNSEVRSHAVRALGFIANPKDLKFFQNISIHEKDSEVIQTIEGAVENISKGERKLSP